MSKHPTFSYDVDEYAERLRGLSDQAFVEEAFKVIDRANQSHVYSLADAQAGQCYDEAQRRPGGDALYDRGFKAAYSAAKGDQHYGRVLVALGGAAA